jgi:hypothetical protein
MNYFDSDMPNSTKTVVYYHGKDDNLYIYICGQGHKQFIRCRLAVLSFDQTITHQHVLSLRESLIHGTVVTIILCLHVLIAHRIFINC